LLRNLKLAPILSMVVSVKIYKFYCGALAAPGRF
jgi:hypothetical protein